MNKKEFDRKVELVKTDPRFIGTHEKAVEIVTAVYGNYTN